MSIAQATRRHVEDTLARSRTRTEAAKALGITLDTLARWTKAWATEDRIKREQQWKRDRETFWREVQGVKVL